MPIVRYFRVVVALGAIAEDLTSIQLAEPVVGVRGLSPLPLDLAPVRSKRSLAEDGFERERRPAAR
jgi:hypothetical protein